MIPHMHTHTHTHTHTSTYVRMHTHNCLILIDTIRVTEVTLVNVVTLGYQDQRYVLPVDATGSCDD